MIASVSGTVAALAPDGVVVEVGGVGLAVQCSPNTIAGLRVGEAARLATSLIVREDSLTLYGFASEDERSLFELLQTSSGVGPRLAQAVLAVHQPDTVRRAVASGDVATLTLVPGIGKKGAERMILELKDRIGAIGAGGVAPAAGPASAWQAQVTQGLTSLGWAQRDAEEAAAAVAEGAGPDPDVAALLKRAIRLLGRR